jgi:hypothetical protein
VAEEGERSQLDEAPVNGRPLMYYEGRNSRDLATLASNQREKLAVLSEVPVPMPKPLKGALNVVRTT